MVVSEDCPRCNGMGEVIGSTPNARARFVHRDDMNPDDYAEPCQNCAGTGVVDRDMNDEIEDWMETNDGA